jgi:hypothetical protein
VRGLVEGDGSLMARPSCIRSTHRKRCRPPSAHGKRITLGAANRITSGVAQWITLLSWIVALLGAAKRILALFRGGSRIVLLLGEGVVRREVGVAPCLRTAWASRPALPRGS